MLLRVNERWALLSMLPADEGTGLTTGLVIKRMKEKLLMSSEEVEELQMSSGVICDECNSPVENRGTAEEPEYYCIVCGDFVAKTHGFADKTTWSIEADVGKNIELNKIERSVYISTFNKLDETDGIKPVHVEVWSLLSKAYPKSFPMPEELDGDEE